MGKSVTIIPRVPPIPRLQRVAAYARVSAGKDAMLHSLAAQVDYYSHLIQSNPMWIYVGVYADSAITGTKDSRPEFQRLLSDCRNGVIDLVLVKSISRLARNTVTLLETVRELRALGIDIFFEEQNLHTLSSEGDLMISILASFFQEESRSVSENCLWRIRRKFSKGESNAFDIYGYRFQDGRLVVEPGEATVVKRVFQMYLDGMGTRAIANRLNKENIPTRRGKQWYHTTIMTMIRDEKYTGNMLLQKSYCSDHLTKRTVKNNGERRQYMVSNSHDAIIDQNIFDRVQSEIARRVETFTPGSNSGITKHPLSGKIVCGLCGKHFRRRYDLNKASCKAPHWVCSTYLTKKKEACASHRLSEDVLMSILSELFSNDDPLSQVNRIDEVIVFPDGRMTVFIEGVAHEMEWSSARTVNATTAASVTSTPRTPNTLSSTSSTSSTSTTSTTETKIINEADSFDKELI